MSRPPQSGVSTRANVIAAKVGIGHRTMGVEVGVFAGDLSECLLELMPRLTLLLVDSWRAAADTRQGDDPHGLCTQEEHDGYFSETMAKVDRFGERARVLMDTSISAATKVPDRAFDFVFLDADHTYEAVKADLLAWAPKVRPGGLLCGHDYNNAPYDGVKQAVDEWVGARGFATDLDKTWFAVMR